MFPRWAQGVLVVLLPILLLPMLALAQNDDEVRIIQVDPDACNVYGHWISEDGKVELRYEGGKTYADGWQISPILSRNAVERNKVPEISRRSSVGPKRRLVLDVCARRDSMLSSGASVEETVSACMTLLRSSGLVDLEASDVRDQPVERGIQHVGGTYFRVYWNNRPPSQMNLGRIGIPTAQVKKDENRAKNARGIFEAVVRNLTAGNMYLTTCYPLPSGSFIPRESKDRVAVVLQEAASSSSPITHANWSNDEIISYGYAEQMRHPLPASRKGQN